LAENVENDDRRHVLIRMPYALKREIQKEAFERESNMNDIILEKLAAAFGMKYELGHRRSVPFGGGKRKGALTKA
jgi:hypothetical protein